MSQVLSAPRRTARIGAGPRPLPLRESVLHHLRYALGKDQYTREARDWYTALASAVRERLIDGWVRSRQQRNAADAKWVNYLSAEYLPGRVLDLVLDNLELRQEARETLAGLGADPDGVLAAEWDAGLGAGGLGRLAACYLESMSTLGIPAYGYGIRYEFGSFTQHIDGGRQVESADNWLRYGYPWEIPRRDRLYPVRFGGRVELSPDGRPTSPARWTGSDALIAMAYDLPIPGYRGASVNTLRLWSAKCTREFDLALFNGGGYARAVEEKVRAESVCRVLYPRDDNAAGHELRLRQEYLLVAASMADVLRRFKRWHSDFASFTAKVAVQINDAHPALAIPELMRLLVDEEGVEWDRAWRICTATFGFTNHTLMPEALEHWPVDLFGGLLPRHLQIVYELNERHLTRVRAEYPADRDRPARMSLIQEYPEKSVRMAHLAALGSHAVNGVSALHSDLLKAGLFRDFDAAFPGRFANVTNGVSPRVWLKGANPDLARLLTDVAGDGWVTRLEELERIAPLAEDAGFRAAWAAVRRRNKTRLADFAHAELGVTLDPDSLFDCQIKRIHEYKRQLLNLLHVIVRYNRIRDGREPAAPRTVLFAGKAAPGYAAAKRIVQLINAVAAGVNADPHTNGLLRIAFLPNYGVSLATRIAPACDLSEQISTAGTEASGTGNMKMALNGALTIGTPDGANVELRSAVGAENFYSFGLSASDGQTLRREGYDPWRYVAACDELRRAVAMIRDGFFSPGEPNLFRAVADALLTPSDPFLVLADYADYAATQDRIGADWLDSDAWTRRSILNTARAGFFSSDRAVREYATAVWHVPVPGTVTDESRHPATRIQMPSKAIV